MLDDGDLGLRRVAPYPGLMQFRPAGAQARRLEATATEKISRFPLPSLFSGLIILNYLSLNQCWSILQKSLL